tara:strand:+ start:18192 stop:18476 length:285 start_codon:yes stop_codon:yes gene_type:complete
MNIPKKARFFKKIQLTQQKKVMEEFILWGKTNPNEEEKILLTRIEGVRITDQKDANWAKNLLTKKYNCTGVRIQKINLEYPENLNNLFENTINK